MSTISLKVIRPTLMQILNCNFISRYTFHKSSRRLMIDGGRNNERTVTKQERQVIIDFYQKNNEKV